MKRLVGSTDPSASIGDAFRRRWLIVPAAVALALAACGSDEDQEPQAENNPTATAEQTPDSITTESDVSEEVVSSVELSQFGEWLINADNIAKIQQSVQPGYSTSGEIIPASEFNPKSRPQTLDDLDDPLIINRGYWSNLGVTREVVEDSTVNESNVKRFVYAAHGDQEQLDYFLNEKCVLPEEAKAQERFAQTMFVHFFNAMSNETDPEYMEHFRFYAEWMVNSQKVLELYIQEQGSNIDCQNPPLQGGIASISTPPLWGGWDIEMIDRWAQPEISDVPGEEFESISGFSYPDYHIAYTEADAFLAFRDSYLGISQSEIRLDAPVAYTAIYSQIAAGNPIFKDPEVADRIMKGEIMFIDNGLINGEFVGTAKLSDEKEVSVLAVRLEDLLPQIQGREARAALQMAASQVYTASLATLR